MILYRNRPATADDLRRAYARAMGIGERGRERGWGKKGKVERGLLATLADAPRGEGKDNE
jgi:hypothetical protein